MRVRALIALLSDELLGVPMTLPEFPVLKGIKGIGMSDSPELAEKLAAKLDYTNTFYHQPPLLDVTQPNPTDFERYDFILSSEVMEHVPPPVETAFANIFRLLKPNGVLILTTPYSLGGKTREHFPELHDFTLASLNERTVLVNRRRDGLVEVFEDLVFHGGPGSTVEMRVFTEESLHENLLAAGFSTVRVATENLPEFGIEHAETWSLPMVARKGEFYPRPAELAKEYRNARRLATHLEEQLAQLQGEYERHVAHHRAWHQETTRQLAERYEWGLNLDREKADLDGELTARTEWAQSLDREIAGLRQRLIQLQEERAEWHSKKWIRLGRRLRVL